MGPDDAVFTLPPADDNGFVRVEQELRFKWGWFKPRVTVQLWFDSLSRKYGLRVVGVRF